MNSITRTLSILGLTLAGALAASAPVSAGDVGVTVYGGGRNHGYAVSWHDNDRRHNGYRYDDRHYRGDTRRYQRHRHPYTYYGFDGGYYGIHDGNSYEDVFALAYDRGYRDGYNARGHHRPGDTRAYRRGYDLGYRDGARDARNAPRRYRHY